MNMYKKVIWISTLAALILLIPLIVYFFRSGKTAAPPEAVPPPPPKQESASGAGPLAGEVRQTAEPEVKEDPEPPPAIRLNDSDKKVREMLVTCSGNENFREWLNRGDLVRRFVAVVDNIAEGRSPGPHLEFLRPAGAFEVKKEGEKVFIEPGAYQRYNGVAEVLLSLDGKKLAALYRQLKPLLVEAYKELGYPDKDFEETLRQAFTVLLNTPLPEGDVLLEERVTTYAFSDKRMELLMEAQKHLLRMGPRNAARIKGKIRELISELEGG